jgi:hypothetical protein
MDELLVCEVCGKDDCEELVGKTGYNGNRETRMMCYDCYEEIHGKKFDE